MTRSQMKILIKIGYVLLLLSSYLYADHATEGLRILNENSNEVKKKYDLITYGSGGAMMEDIEILDLRFNSVKKLTISEARKFYVNIIEELISKVNNDKKVRPYLHDYPFTRKNVDIMIVFYNSHNYIKKNLVEENVALIGMTIKGHIIYKIYDHTKDEYHDLVTIHEESYEEALKIVQEEAQKNVENSDSKPDENIN